MCWSPRGHKELDTTWWLSNNSCPGVAPELRSFHDAPKAKRASSGHALAGPFPSALLLPQVRPCLQLKDPRQSGSPQRLRSAFLGHSMAGPHPSCLQPGSAQIQDPQDTALFQISGSHSLSPPTRPLGLEFYETGLAFYKRQKEHLASSCFGFLPGKIKNPLRQKD